MIKNLNSQLQHKIHVSEQKWSVSELETFIKISLPYKTGGHFGIIYNTYRLMYNYFNFGSFEKIRLYKLYVFYTRIFSTTP